MPRNFFDIEMDRRYTSTDLKTQIRYKLSEIESSGYDDSLTHHNSHLIYLIIKNNPALKKIPLLKPRDFTRFPNFLNNICSLTIQNLTGLREISNLDLYPNLKELILSAHHRTELVCDFKVFPKLENKLVVENFKVVIPDEIKEQTELGHLTLYNCIVEELSDEISNLPELRTLEVLETKIRIPDNFENLRNLEFLSFSRKDGNEMTSENFDKVLKFPKLRHLDLEGQLEIVRDLNINSGDFQSLEKLKINRIFSDNLQEILEKIHHVPTLKVLDLYLNSITSIPITTYLPNLNILNLSDNKITELPLEFATNLPNLKKLEISRNNLDELPENIGELKNLEYFDISGNPDIPTLPESISNLTDLTELKIKDCDLIIYDISRIVDNIPKNAQEIISLFKPGCPLRVLLLRGFNNNRNESKTIRECYLRTLKTVSNQPEDLLVNKVRFNLIDTEILNNLEQIINYLEETETEIAFPGNSMTQSDIFINGLFYIIPPEGGVAIDAGGPYRQFLSSVNKQLNKEEIFSVNRMGDLTTKITDRDRLKRIIGVLIILFNSGEGLFKSSVNFGHVVNIYIQLHGKENVIKELKSTVKEFAIVFLNEDKERVKLLMDEDVRLLTYLWLMVEYVDNGMVITEDSNCKRVKDANISGDYEGFYDYIFTGAPFREPRENTPGNALENAPGNALENTPGNALENETPPDNQAGRTTPLGNRFYNSSEQHEEVDQEQLKLHHLDLISFLERKMEDISNHDYSQQIEMLNGAKRLAEMDELEESHIDFLTETTYRLLNEGDSEEQMLLLFMNDTISFTIEDYKFLNSDQRDNYLRRYEQIKQNILSNQSRGGSGSLNSARIDSIKESISGVLNDIYLIYWNILGNKFGELSVRYGQSELDSRLPDYVEKLRRIERHVGMTGEGYRVYPYQLRNEQDKLIKVMRDLGYESVNHVPLGEMRGGGNSNGIERYDITQSDSYEVSPEIVDAIRYYYERDKNNTSQFILKKRFKYTPFNVFVLYNILKPKDNVDIEKLLSKINFYSNFPTRQREIFEDILKNYKHNLQDEDIDEINRFITENTDEENRVLFNELFPDHNTFLTKLLEFWTGSLKISGDPYKVGFNGDSYAFDAHTCFNELIVNNFNSEVEFLKMFIRSLFTIGTNFGIAGRTKKKKPRNSNKKKKRIISKRNRRNIKKRTQNKIGNFISRARDISKSKRERTGKSKRERIGKRVRTGKRERTTKRERIDRNKKERIGRFSIRTKKLK